MLSALQILNLLTEKEVNIVLPTHSIVPRTFVLQPGMVLFLGAIGRIDFLQVRNICIPLKNNSIGIYFKVAGI